MPISPIRTVAGHLSQKSTGDNKISGRAKFRKLRGGKEKKKKEKEVFNMEDSKQELLLPTFDAGFLA